MQQPQRDEWHSCAALAAESAARRKKGKKEKNFHRKFRLDSSPPPSPFAIHQYVTEFEILIDEAFAVRVAWFFAYINCNWTFFFPRAHATPLGLQRGLLFHRLRFFRYFLFFMFYVIFFFCSCLSTCFLARRYQTLFDMLNQVNYVVREFWNVILNPSLYFFFFLSLTL